jgi:hypothetical protein
MDDLSEKTVIVQCGLRQKVPGSTIENCYDCGTQVYVSPNTVPRMEDLLKKGKIEGYHFFCPNCSGKRHAKAAKEGEPIVEIPNPSIQNHWLN